MEGKKKGCSPSSFTADLFGAKESSPSSSVGSFASIFPPPSAVVGKNSPSTEVTGSWQKQNPEIQTWNMKQGTPAVSSGGACSSIPNKDRSSIFQEDRVEPCHLSSSLYYGGQDIYSQSPSTQTSGYPLFKEHGAEDENGNSASRGNWWQGNDAVDKEFGCKLKKILCKYMLTDCHFCRFTLLLGPCLPGHKNSPSVFKEFVEPGDMQADMQYN